jgi:ankyrin repeat protein
LTVTLDEYHADDYEILSMLLANGADPFRDTYHGGKNYEKNAFCLAAFLTPMGSHSDRAQDITRIVQLLIETCHADPNTAHGTKGSRTLLMEAAFAGNASLVEYLLAIGADKATTINGKTAYDYAMEMGYTEIAEMVRP